MSDSQVPQAFQAISTEIDGDCFVFTLPSEEEAIAAYKAALGSNREATRNGVTLRVRFKSAGRGCHPDPSA